MTQLDPRIQSALGRSRASHSPPAGCEDDMLAQFHARLGGPGNGGEGGEGMGNGGVGGAMPSYTAGAQLVYGLQIAAAIVGLTTAGLGGLWLGGKAMRATDAPDQVSVDGRVDARPELETEPPMHPEAKLPDTQPTTRIAAPEAAPLSRPSPTRPVPATSTPTKSATTLAAELQLIHAARNAPPLQALELIDRHAEQFPDGEFRHEREGLRVIALCELGRLDEARRASEGFLARSPGALLIQRVSAGCRDRISLPTTETPPAGNRSP
jgi:hypothetical protein